MSTGRVCGKSRGLRVPIPRESLHSRSSRHWKARELGHAKKGNFSKLNHWKNLPKIENKTNIKLQDRVRSYLELTGGETVLRFARTGHGKVRV